MTKLDREELATLCRRGLVPVDKWSNRDSAEAQIQLATAAALLEAGCGFMIRKDMDGPETIWVQITWPGFAAFDYDGGDDSETFYIPTRERLDRAAGGDWY